MEVDITNVKNVTPAMKKYLQENDLEKFAQYQAAIESVTQVKTALGVLANRNAREALTNRLLLALLEGNTPEQSDIDALKAAYQAVDQSSAKASIVGE